MGRISGGRLIQPSCEVSSAFRVSRQIAKIDPNPWEYCGIMQVNFSKHIWSACKSELLIYAIYQADTCSAIPIMNHCFIAIISKLYLKFLFNDDSSFSNFTTVFSPPSCVCNVGGLQGKYLFTHIISEVVIHLVE